MRVIIFSLFLTFSSYALDKKEFAEIDPNYTKYIEKIENFIRKKKVCLFASTTISSSDNIPTPESRYPDKFTCITDIVKDKGTINEKSGCSLVSYNVKTGKYEKYASRYHGQAIASKPCMAGGFEELLKMKGNWGLVTMQEPNTVEYQIFERLSDSRIIKVILLDASKDKVLSWFNKTNELYFNSHESRYRKINAKKMEEAKVEKKVKEKAKEVKKINKSKKKKIKNRSDL